MTQERREERESRRRSRRDDDREYRSRRRLPRVEDQYIFAVNGRPKPPEVHGNRFRLGDIVSTSDGPHKVIEVYWLTEHKARVLLRPISEKKKPKTDAKTDAKTKKTQQPKKFNTRGAKSFRQPARKPAREPARKPAQKPARNQNQSNQGTG